MARSHSKSHRLHRRDVSIIANRRLPVFSIKSSTETRRTSGLTLFEDRRLWTPTPDVARLLDYSQYSLTDVPRVSHHASIRRPGRKIEKKNRNPFGVSKLFWNAPRVVAFADPSSTLICMRRSRRREVMFARRKAGKRGQKRPRFNRFSKISCRRSK